MGAATAEPGSQRPSGRTAWARNLAAPVRDFLNTETGGAVALLVADGRRAGVGELAVVGLLRVGLDDGALDPPRRRRASRTTCAHWVNEGLMTFFFLVVGLEAKRELDLGQLRERRRHRRSRWSPRSAAWRCRSLIYLALQRGRRRRGRLGRGDVDRHGVRARRARARGPARHAAARAPADARGGRRPGGAARDRHRLHGAGRAGAARGGGRAVRDAVRAPLRAARVARCAPR